MGINLPHLMNQLFSRLTGLVYTVDSWRMKSARGIFESRLACKQLSKTFRSGNTSDAGRNLNPFTLCTEIRSQRVPAALLPKEPKLSQNIRLAALLFSSCNNKYTTVRLQTLTQRSYKKIISHQRGSHGIVTYKSSLPGWKYSYELEMRFTRLVFTLGKEVQCRTR